VLLFLLVWKEDCKKRPVQCHVFAQSLPGWHPSHKYPINTSDRSFDLCQNVPLAVLFGSNDNAYTLCTQSDVCVCVCVCTYTQTHTLILNNTDTLVGQSKDTNWDRSEYRVLKSFQTCSSLCVLVVFD